MNAAAQGRSDLAPGWLGPLFAAGVLTLAVILLLVLANRQPNRLREVPEANAVTFDTVQIPDPDTPAASAPGPANLGALLPAAAPAALAQLEVRPQPLDLKVDLSQMIQRHYSYRDLGRISSHHGRFGLSSLSDVDEPVQSVFIPPNIFPRSLQEAGVREGRVTVVIVVDEQGRAKVQRVLGSTHPELVNPVVESINRAIYSTPMRNGRPTKVVITRVVVFAAGATRSTLQDGGEPTPLRHE